MKFLATTYKPLFRALYVNPKLTHVVVNVEPCDEDRGEAAADPLVVELHRVNGGLGCEI